MKPTEMTRPDVLYRLKLHFNWLYLVVALVVAEVVVMVLTNTPRTLPVFLILFIILTGLSLELGRMRALLVWLGMMFIWIILKRALGAWTVSALTFNLVEIVLLLSLAWIGGLYHDLQSNFWSAYAEDEMRLHTISLEGEGVGLLRQPVGLLRLDEEQERAFDHQRPLGLLLVHTQIVEDVVRDPRDRLMLLKAVVAAIKDVARDTDIPFQAENERMALILPETDVETMQKVLDRLIENFRDLRYVQATGESRPVKDCAQIRYGYAIYLGGSDDSPDMMAAALRSLERSIEDNQGPVFQNLFIEYQVLGYSPAQKGSVLSILSK